MTKPAPQRAAQFGLRGLFALTATVAVCAFVYRQAGRDEAIGMAIAIGLLALGLSIKHRRWLRRTALVAAGLAAWIATVDYVLYFVRCDRCHGEMLVREVRFLHQPVWTRTTHDSVVLAHVLEDLGQPCTHDMQHRLLLWRFWGLIVPQLLFTGTLGISGDDSWYDSRARELVRQFGAQHPDKGQELSDALARKDHLAVRVIMTEIHTLTSAP
jgi:hypothetical protein